MLVLLLCLNSCANVHYDAVDTLSDGQMLLHSPGGTRYRNRILSLKKDLESLGPDIVESDALLVADTAIRISMVLANEYQLVSPPLYQNHLVNTGKRKRGLCVEWRKDLMEHLSALNQRSFDFHWGVAHHDSEWRYHSSVIVTAKGRPFREGIVLDPWRNSGMLFWTPVKEDRYPWKPDPDKPSFERPRANSRAGAFSGSSVGAGLSEKTGVNPHS